MINHPILVISYNDDVRKALLDNLLTKGATGIACESFLAAEDLAREGVYNGVLVDLQSIVKAKGDEKLIACSLTGFYPTLRVRALGGMLVPMAMPGDARQDNSVADFLGKSCSAFAPRMLRFNRRRDVVLPAFNGCNDLDARLVTLNMSWGGAFFVDVYPEKYQVGQELQLTVPEFDLAVEAVIRWVRPWGQRKVPGIGVSFKGGEEPLESVLADLMQRDRNNDRDRMIAR